MLYFGQGTKTVAHGIDVGEGGLPGVHFLSLLIAIIYLPYQQVLALEIPRWTAEIPVVVRDDEVVDEVDAEYGDEYNLGEHEAVLLAVRPKCL